MGNLGNAFLFINSSNSNLISGGGKCSKEKFGKCLCASPYWIENKRLSMNKGLMQWNCGFITSNSQLSNQTHPLWSLFFRKVDDFHWSSELKWYEDIQVVCLATWISFWILQILFFFTPKHHLLVLFIPLKGKRN